MAQKIAVVGGGPAGLFFSHAALEEGLEVELFEAHSKPGGCASYFALRVEQGERATFDAGATLLWGLDEDFDFLSRLLKRYQVSTPAFLKRKRMSFCVEGRRFDLDVTSTSAMIESLQEAFPHESEALWEKTRALAKIAESMKVFMEAGAHVPLESFQDLLLNARRLPLLLKLSPSFLRFSHVSLEEFFEDTTSKEFMQWVNMSLLISLQERSDKVSCLLGAMALFFYSFGVGSLEGGMKSLFVPLKESLEKKTSAHFRTQVSRIRRDSNGFVINTLKGESFGHYDTVVSAIPRYNAQAITEFELSNSRYEQYSDLLWSAFAAYFVVEDDSSFGAEAFNLHYASEELGEHYLSVSSRDDQLSCPKGMRRLTMSSHEHTSTWASLSKDETKELKAERAEVSRKVLSEALPQAKVLVEDFGSPKTFLRYTRREDGSVGGIPLDFRHSLLRSPSQRSGVPDFYLIGDTSFPGQSVYSCALGALLCLEKILKRPLL